jgi:hypothetical protein
VREEERHPSAMSPRSRTGKVVRWLSGLSAKSLFGLSFAWFLVWTAGVYVVLDTIIADNHQDALATIAGSMMTAFGALFAFLTAFVITIEWNQHREVEHTIGTEADASVRLAWASDAPGVEGASMRASLARYLHSVLDDEWATLAEGSDGSHATHECMRVLQRQVLVAVAQKQTVGAITRELTKAADAMAVTRADRLNAAGHDLPTPLFLLAFLSGIMLSLNAVAVSLHLQRGYSILIGALVVLIAMDLALLVALAAPFCGALVVHSRPIARVLVDLEEGRYGPLEGRPTDPPQP